MARQAVPKGCGFLFFQGFVVTEHVSGGGRRAVSYTHLDVYKRQVYELVG